MPQSGGTGIALAFYVQVVVAAHPKCLRCSMRLKMVRSRDRPATEDADAETCAAGAHIGSFRFPHHPLYFRFTTAWRAVTTEDAGAETCAAVALPVSRRREP